MGFRRQAVCPGYPLLTRDLETGPCFSAIWGLKGDQGSLSLLTGCVPHPVMKNLGKKFSYFENHTAADVESSHPRETFQAGCLSYPYIGIFQYSSSC